MHSPEPAVIITSSSESCDEESNSGSPTSKYPVFIKYLSKIAQKHSKNAKDATTFTKLIATWPSTVKRRSEEPLANLAKRIRKTTSYLCEKCDEPFADKDKLKKHKETCNREEPNETPDTAGKAFPCDKCDKSNASEANLQRHVRDKNAVGARSNKTKCKSYKCRLCKDIRVDIYKHYGTKHNIDNIEQMLFDDGTVLVTSDIETDKGNATWFKEQLEKASKRYNDTTCRLCESFVKFDTTNLLQEHYTVQHKVDPKSLNIIERLFRAEMKAHLGEMDPKSNRADTKSNVSEMKCKSYKCRLCKDIRVDIYKHYGTKHNIDNIEQMLFDDGTVLVTSDIETEKGNAKWFKDQLEKASKRYNDTTCRLCESYVKFDTTTLLKKHYTVQHKVDPKSLNIIKRLFRAEMKAHLGKMDPKLKCADTKSNVSDKKKAITKENQSNDNTRFIYKCKCGKATESYDASVEHSQEHLVARYNNTKMDSTRHFAFETDISDNNVIKVIKYDFDALLTDTWYEMFNDAATYKDSIISTSIYKHSRSVKLRSEDTDSCTGVPAYKCETCQLFVHPTKIERHCKNYRVCARNAPQKFYCNRCDVHFYSEDALEYHKENHAAGFKLVTFSNKNDVEINAILEKLRNRSTDDTQEEEEIEKNPKKNADGKRIEIISVSKFISGEFVDVSAFQAHSAAQQKEKEKYVSALSVVVSYETGSREATEELLHANQVDNEMLTSDGDFSINVYSKENDAECTDESDSSSDSYQSPKYLQLDAEVHTNMSVDENVTDVEYVRSPEVVIREMFGANDDSLSPMSCNEDLQSTQALQQMLGNDDNANENHEERQVSQEVFNEDMTQDQNEVSAEKNMIDKEACEANNVEQDTVEAENEGVRRKSSKEIINEIPHEDMSDRDYFFNLNALIFMTLPDHRIDNSTRPERD